MSTVRKPPTTDRNKNKKPSLSRGFLIETVIVGRGQYSSRISRKLRYTGDFYTNRVPDHPNEMHCLIVFFEGVFGLVDDRVSAK
jgi:hypothetical protein